jgi:peptide-methionine (R)-S-oxide reductase
VPHDQVFDLEPLTPEERERLAADLSAEERAVILFQGTETPFCGGLLSNKRSGAYVCRLCGLPLFEAKAKFDSGTGWPSFFETYANGHVREVADASHGMVRTEIRCQRCDGHLGHVFPDGPPPTGRRFCLNSVALEFVEDGQPLPDKLRRTGR